MLQVYYTNGIVSEFEGGKSEFTKTPKNSRRWAVALVTGSTANQDIYMTRLYVVDSDGVESVETFKNTVNVQF